MTTIYDRLIRSTPINRLAIKGLTAKDFKPSSIDEKIKALCEEAGQIDKTLCNIKVNHCFNYSQRRRLIDKKYEVSCELARLRRMRKSLNPSTFKNVFFKVAKEKLSSEVFEDIRNIAHDIVHGAEKCLEMEVNNDHES